MAHVINTNPSNGYMRFDLAADVKSFAPDDIVVNMPGRGTIHIRSESAGCSARVRKTLDQSLITSLTTLGAGTITAMDAGVGAMGITIEIEGYTTGLIEIETTTDAGSPEKLI
jgi:hypothetical protein